MFKSLLFYIKTTETCNLNCSHCFTSGSNGRRIFFDPDKVANWINQFKEYTDPDLSPHFEFHGGEPFLGSTKNMRKFHELTKDTWENATYGATTNLTYILSEDKLDFMETVLEKTIGTSWDPKIRFANESQLKLFENNVRFLVSRGFNIKLFVSLSRDVISKEPIELLRYVKSLGVSSLALERITVNGNAVKNINIIPTNKELDNWFLRLHQQSQEYNTREWFFNDFLESVYMKFENSFTKAGNFCRDCEQKLFTINADGTVGGCPNSAPVDHYATIEDNVSDVLVTPKRCQVITEELTPNTNCFNCPAYTYCGGDCHKLDWEGNICPAPKTLMLTLLGNKKPFKRIIIEDITKK